MSSAISGGWVLGYHGCSREVAELALSGKETLKSSTNDHDWLGNGIYFWEDDCSRALKWAREKHGNQAYVVGCVINLGHCLNLQKQDHLDLLIQAHNDLLSIHDQLGSNTPTNTGGADKLCRKLDCAVIQLLHNLRAFRGLPIFDTVRGFFGEGDFLYEGAGFRKKDHVQICVRNPGLIRGYFRHMELFEEGQDISQAGRLTGTKWTKNRSHEMIEFKSFGEFDYYDGKIKKSSHPFRWIGEDAIELDWGGEDKFTCQLSANLNSFRELNPKKESEWIRWEEEKLLKYPKGSTGPKD